MSEAEKSVGAICAGWWAHDIGAESGASRRARAELRRAAGPIDALAVSAVHALNTRLRTGGHDMRRGNGPDRLALIAVALAHLKDGRGPAAAQAFGKGDPPVLGEIRFNALIRARTPRELWKPLIRALAVIKGQADAARLASDIFYWNDTTRTRWCFDYYGEAFAAPQAEETPS